MRRSGPAKQPPGSRSDADDPVLPAVTEDERDVGWGGDPQAGAWDDDWYRRERPPHHE